MPTSVIVSDDLAGHPRLQVGDSTRVLMPHCLIVVFSHLSSPVQGSLLALVRRV